jgi:hypothetical protein
VPVSLAQAKLNTTDDVDVMVIDEFRKSSALLDALIFDDVVSPAGGGSTLTYGYTRQITQRSAAFRAVNNEYTPVEATKARYTVDLKPLGGSFQVDRVLNDIGQARETAFQMAQVIKATQTKFQDEVINGDVAVDANGFDGLNKALTNSATEINANGSRNIDWTDLDVAGVAQKGYDFIDELYSVLDGPPSLLISNDLVCNKIRAIARRSNAYVEAPEAGLLDDFGNPITRQRVGNAILIDAGAKAGTNTRVVPVYDPDNTTFTVTVTGSPTGGTFTLLVAVGTDAPVESGTIAHNAAGSAVDTALEAMSNVGAGNVTVTGAGPYTITFNGALARADVSVTLGTNALTGGTAPTVTSVESANTGGFSDLYAVRIGMDGFHAVSTIGQLVRQWLPDFTTAGAVKTGEVEMGPVATVLKATKAAAVLRRIKVR